MPRARVYVTLKKSVFDPQGKTIHEALRSLGYGSVTDVRQGQFFEVALDGVPADQARATVEAIARFSPVMGAVKAFAAQGGPVLGICNGFQILQEAGLLPGAMLRNRTVKFLSQPVHIRVERDDTIATAGVPVGTVLTMPIAHGEGNFFLPDPELDRLEAEGRVAFRYVDAAGRLDDAANVNGSARAIAGVCNADRNVVGLMPHPERASEGELGSADGRRIFEALIGSLVRA